MCAIAIASSVTKGSVICELKLEPACAVICLTQVTTTWRPIFCWISKRQQNLEKQHPELRHYNSVLQKSVGVSHNEDFWHPHSKMVERKWKKIYGKDKRESKAERELDRSKERDSGAEVTG